jgi:hypothetical protein
MAGGQAPYQGDAVLVEEGHASQIERQRLAQGPPPLAHAAECLHPRPAHVPLEPQGLRVVSRLTARDLEHGATPACRRLLDCHLLISGEQTACHVRRPREAGAIACKTGGL